MPPPSVEYVEVILVRMLANGLTHASIRSSTR